MKVYACSDLHGHLSLLEQIQNKLAEDDKVYYLGDAGDRGPQPWETIKAILDDPRFIYIRGNHDKMLLDAYIDYIEFADVNDRLALLRYNGGMLTFEQCIEDPQASTYINRLHSAPYKKFFIDLEGKEMVLTHAGYTPWKNKPFPHNYDLIWDRNHIFDKWNANKMYDTIIVHGHTPIDYIDDMISKGDPCVEIKPYWYCDNHKVCIDAGTYNTKKAILMDLNTFEYEVIE